MKNNTENSRLLTESYFILLGGIFSSEFLWFKGLCAIAALLAFMDVKRKINKYKVAL
ncbi:MULTISPECIES: hypothetical protein [unclassified Bacillus (in: firmicutes)]|uniref:hypothetical protein n=1 Tax=unclassified Bacillus (in: firmicutes) TaxID=185979 RepID=UPI0023DBD386|nr:MULTISPECIES: hypothetical protein [unclassified Bacillus (in: firmicutes)]MCU4760092.1 hypothetical protein [Bacillus cereus]MCU5109551.1 hypothetical protein [Bacillus cereus]MCU5342878.1 hypothetical protein [Bacillus cereus]MDF2018470.1 hypothetical protein [Bacillus sp. Cr_R3]MDF2032952.1 hypothetical protein [Bacillus sp. Cr_R16]